jgi:hypothetical protein
MKVGIVIASAGFLVVQAFIGWLVFFALPSLSSPWPPSPPSPPACILDGGRPLHTLLLTFCIPTDAQVTLADGADALTHIIAVPKAVGLLHITTGPLIIAEEYAEHRDIPRRLSRSEEFPGKPKIVVSVCKGFHVVDALWTRPDGFVARVVITLGAWSEYGWIRPADALLFDQILNKPPCEGVRFSQ